MPRHKFWPNVKRVNVLLQLLILLVMVMRMNIVSMQKNEVE